MFGFLHLPTWPPQLEPDETALLDGRASPRRYWQQAALITLLMIPAWFGIAWLLEGVFGWLNPNRPDRDASRVGSLIWLVIFMTALHYWFMLQNARWMLTSRRFIQRGKGAIPRAEIGAITFQRPDSIVIHRAGNGELLKGARFYLAYLDGAKSVRDVLERLK